MNPSKAKRNKKKRAAAFSKQRGLVQQDAEGRVHLVLHRDAVSGGESLTLRNPIFKEVWQNNLAAATANTAYGLLGEQPSLPGTIALAKNAMAATSRIAEGLLSRAPEGAVACRAGCDHCCHQSVGVTALEALAIFDHVKATLSGAELLELATSVSELHERTLGLSWAERFSPDYPCPFLKASRCSIYEVRPLACRGMNSLDAGECASRLREPQARAEFLANGLGGRSFMEPIRAFHAISAGLQLSLSELYYLDMRPLELTSVMHLLLSGPESLSGAWLTGQTPFESACTSDGRDDPGLRELSGTLPFTTDRKKQSV